MRRKEFIAELKNNLAKFPASEVADIIRDQEEYFDAAIEAGRSEEDITRALGDPRALAASFVAERAIQRAASSVSFGQRLREVPRIFGALLILAPLNFIVILGPYLLATVLLFVLWGLSLGLGFGAIWGFGEFHLAHAGAAAIGLSRTLAIDFFAVGVGAASGLLAVLMIHVTRYFLLATIAYLRWNLGFVSKFQREAA